MLVTSVNLIAQDLDEILDNYFEVIGQEKMLEYNSFIISGNVVQMGMEFPMKLYQKRPGKVRMEAEIQGAKMVQAYNGEVGWSVMPWTGSLEPQDMSEDELKSMKQMADMDGDLYDWKKKDFVVTLTGKDEIEGSPVFKIKLVKPDGDEFIYYIDAENFVILQVDAKTIIQGVEMEVSSLHSNYKPVAGMIIAHSVEQIMNGQTAMQMVFESFEVDAEIDDSMFEKPSN